MSKFCPYPFEWLDITSWNEGHTIKFALCVRCWGGDGAELAVVPLEQAADFDIMALWNGEKAKRVRREMLENADGAAFCSGCTFWQSGSLPVRERSPEDSGRLIENDGPLTLNLAYDRSCNLCCPSCRESPIIHRQGTPWHAQLKAFQDKAVRRLLKTASRAFVAGMGDPFGSPLYWELLTTTHIDDAPLIRWYILTNGHGFTEENYHAIPTHERIDIVQFSLDAATEDTYRMNRGNGWRHVLNNLEFASAIRKQGRLDGLHISMVVQQNNYREIPAFVELAKAHSVDVVKLNPFYLLRSLPRSEYAARAVHLPGHEHHAECMALVEQAKADGGVEVQCEF